MTLQSEIAKRYDHRRVHSIVMYSDGGARGNPGHAGAGFFLRTSEGEVLLKQAIYLGETTNNCAEYAALLEGVRAALYFQPTTLHCYLDSELIVKQLKGEYRVKDAKLRILYNELVALLDAVDWRAEHVRREKNVEADRLANVAMDRGKKVGETFTYFPQSDTHE